MKKYLVTEHYEDRGGGDTTHEIREELPPNARVLTREDVDRLAAMLASTAPDNWALYTECMDELFGAQE